jgi:hypothetical protein
VCVCVCVHSLICSGELSKDEYPQIFIFAPFILEPKNILTMGQLFSFNSQSSSDYIRYRASELCSNEETSLPPATKMRMPTSPLLTITEGSIQSLHVFRTNDGWDYRALIRANEYDYSAFLTKSFPCACVRIIR